MTKSSRQATAEPKDKEAGAGLISGAPSPII